jgi:hypothetical protein
VKPKKQKNLVVKFVSDVKKVNNIFRTRKWHKIFNLIKNKSS